jgi:hypothetical protein
MDSGLYLSIFLSWEVIAACLFLMFLLPLVFFLASTNSRRRIPLRVLRARVPAKKRTQGPTPRPAEGEDEEKRDERPSSRRGERPEETEEDT